MEVLPSHASMTIPGVIMKKNQPEHPDPAMPGCLASQVHSFWLLELVEFYNVPCKNEVQVFLGVVHVVDEL